MASPAAALPAPPQVCRNGRRVTLGRFATAEEAALCYARSPEAKKEEERAAKTPKKPETAKKPKTPATVHACPLCPPMPALPCT